MKALNIKGLIVSAAIFVCALTLAVVLMLCMDNAKSPPEEESSERESETNMPPEAEAISTDSYVYLTDISAYKSILNTKDDKYKTLVNKENPLGAEYAPESLTALDKSITLYEKYIELEHGAAQAATALVAEMRAQGFKDVYVTSAYRSYAYQKQLFDNYCEQERQKNPSLGEDEIREKVLTYSAAPGTSEHQSGLCMDLFISPGMTDLVNYGYETDDYPDDVGFAETPEFLWLKDNAHKFGFILRFPDGKENETGYNYESWHYRFVGIDMASKIKASGLTLEKYLEQNS